MVTKRQKVEILRLREQGLGYKKIGDRLGLSRDCVRNACTSMKKQKTTDDSFAEGLCRMCGSPISVSGKGRPRKFCSDTCRMQYWSTHRAELKRNPASVYTKICLYCGKTFEVYGHKEAKYCCHDHAIRARFGDKNAG